MNKISIPSEVVSTFKEFETNSKKNNSLETRISIVKGLLSHGFKTPEFSLLLSLIYFKGFTMCQIKMKKKRT